MAESLDQFRHAKYNDPGPIPTADVIHPGTGEILAVREASTADLARFLADCREYESLLREAKSIVSREAIRRMDLEGQWTARADGWVLRSQSPEPQEEFDVVPLLKALHELADQGLISEEAIERAVETVTDYKIRAQGIKALRKRGGLIKETVDRFATPMERKRTVSVSRPA
jgi:hypothetical protein